MKDVNKSILLEIGKTLSNLGKIEDAMAKFSQMLMSNIISPYLSREYGFHTNVEIRDNSLSLVETPVKTDTTNAIDTVRMVLKFLKVTLPQPLHVSISSYLLQPLSMSLRRCWLEPSMQKALNEMQLFDDETHSLRQLADYIDEIGWFGKDLLLELIKSIPRLWITRRKETALANVRSVCSGSVSSKFVAERVELHVLAERNAVDEKHDDDWESEWPDDANDDDKTGTKANNHNARSDLSDGVQGTKIAKRNGESKTVSEADSGTNEKETPDDWDWENEDTKNSTSEPQVLKQNIDHSRVLKGIRKNDVHSDEDMRRCVKYTITKIPDTLAEAIEQLIDDANYLSRPR